MVLHVLLDINSCILVLIVPIPDRLHVLIRSWAPGVFDMDYAVDAVTLTHVIQLYFSTMSFYLYLPFLVGVENVGFSRTA